MLNRRTKRTQSQACLSYAEQGGGRRSQATNAISDTDYRSKSFIALKEARESLYWIQLLHRNGYIDDKQFESIYGDCEELVKILVTRCKKMNEAINAKGKK